MDINVNTIKDLADSSFLNYTDNELGKIAADLSAIVKTFDIIKGLDIKYDPLKDNKGASLKNLREDIAKPSMPIENLLKNSLNRNNSFVVPKVLD